MNICFVTYWSVKEGLSQATVLPHLLILAEFDAVESIQLLSMERNGEVEKIDLPKVIHHPIYTSDSVRDKLTDNAKAKRLLSKLHAEKPIDLLMARGVMAAWLSLKFVTMHHVRFSIESFEPHADYMAEDGVWRKLGLRYRVLAKAEKTEKQVADFILPVTDAYKQKLIEEEGVNPDKVITMPCCVDVSRFQFDISHRTAIRTELGLSSDKIVGVYTGKIGGIYLKDEAIALLKLAQRHFGKEKFYLIILSPDHASWEKVLRSAGFETHHYHIGFVDLLEVGAYLSAADFALSLHRPTPSKIGISPIKNGEYFANGLPVVMPAGIGDDSELVKSLNFGSVISDVSNIDPLVFKPIDSLIQKDRSKSRIAQWAQEHRSFDLVRANYEYILKTLLQES